MNIETLAAVADAIVADPWQSEHRAAELGEQYGLEYLAAGLDRYVYRAGDKVYKFANRTDSKQQKQEMENYHAMVAYMESNPEKCRGWGLPQMEAVYAGEYLVIVADYVGDEYYEWGYENPWNASDAHSGNARLYNGIRYIIDLGLAHRDPLFCK